MPSGARPGGGVGIAMILFIFMIMKSICENIQEGFWEESHELGEVGE